MKGSVNTRLKKKKSVLGSKRNLPGASADTEKAFFIYTSWLNITQYSYGFGESQDGRDLKCKKRGVKKKIPSDWQHETKLTAMYSL